MRATAMRATSASGARRRSAPSETVTEQGLRRCPRAPSPAGVLARERERRRRAALRRRPYSQCRGSSSGGQEIQAAVFHYGSISLIAEPCRSAHLRAMEIAKEAGALLSYDPNLREALWPSHEEARTKILSIWDQADIVKVSEVELEFLTGIDSVEDDVVMKLWRPTFKLLLVTLGDQGCKYYARDFRGSVPSYKVQQVDTTGAGDAFVGALLRKIVQDPSSLQDQKKLEEAIKFANACGAITTMKKGAIPSLPTETEVLRLMENA